MKLEKKEYESRSFRGIWVEATFEEAMTGKVSQAIHRFLELNHKIQEFVGISIHHQKDGFKYFIGTQDDEGQIILPRGCYLSAQDFSDPYSVYMSLENEPYTYKAFFEGSHQNDAIPIKMEFYKVHDREAKCTLIEVPIEC